MKLGFLARITLATGALVALALAITSYGTFHRINQVLEEKEIDALEIATGDAVRRVVSILDEVRRDVKQISGTDPVAGLVRARLAGGVDPVDGSTEERWRGQLEHIFEAMLSSQSRYTQIRLIGVADEGREIVRVERSGRDITQVRGESLQRKGGEGYFRDGLRVGHGKVFFSEISLNREHGRIQEPHVPVVRALMRVMSPNDGHFGFLVVNVDLTRLLEDLRSDVKIANSLRMANDRGYYLVHPDPSRAFGFDLGHDHRIQADFPELTGFVGGGAESSRRLRKGEDLIVVNRVPFNRGISMGYLMVALSEPRAEALAASLHARNESLIVALGMILFSVLCVVAMGRRVMRRIGGEPGEIEALAAQVAAGDLTVDVGESSDEASGIYGSFRRMVASLRERTEMLELSEARSKAIVETASDGIITIDAQGIILSFNGGAESMFGYLADEVVGRNVRILTPEPHRSLHDGYLRNYLVGGEAKIIGSGREVEGRHKDGSMVPLRLQVGEARIRDERMFTGILYDISESRAAAETLLTANQTLAAQNLLRERTAHVVELSRGVWDLGSLANTVLAELARFVGAGAGALYAVAAGGGETENLMLAGSYGRGEPFDASSPLPGLVRQCARDRRAILLEPVPPDYAPIESGVGKAAPLRVLLTPVVFADEVQGVLELAAFEDFDQAARDLLESVVTGLGAVIAAIADRARIEGLLHEAQRLQEEAQAQSEELQVSNEELAQKSEALEEQRAQLEAQTEELRVANEEGEQRSEELRLANDALSREKIELEAAREAVESKSRDLETASRYKSEFLANMSHELRTPLNSLLILAKSLATNEERNLSEDQVECATVIHEAGHDLLTLINDILDLSKVEAGRLEIIPAEVAPGQIAEAMQRQFGPTASQKNLELRIEVAEGTPGGIVTDAHRVEQILRNLLSNAFKFTKAGSVVIHLHPTEPGVTLRNPLLVGAPSVAFAVEDTGMGIPPEKQEAIFEAFQQADGSTSRHFGGTGLGLTISRELARILGGELHVRSEVGRGSRFTLYLPVAGPPADGADRDEAPAAHSEPSVDLAEEPERLLADDRGAIEPGDREILVVEDDVRFATILMERAREQGYKCVVVGTGSGAIQMLARRRPAAVVLDLGLPDMDGSCVLEHLASNPATAAVPIHVISARDAPSSAMVGTAIPFTRKPIERDEIDAILANLAQPAQAGPRRILLIEDSEGDRLATTALLAKRGVEVTAVASGPEALAQLRAERFDCMVLDFQLGDTTALLLLEEIRTAGGMELPPVVIYTARDLTEEEHGLLRSHAHTVVVKGDHAAPRLLDEVSLFLHKVDRTTSGAGRPASAPAADLSLAGRKVLVADDDLRNTFALSRALRAEGLEVTIAENGATALEKLAANPGLELVVMDMMMPVMDGLEATRRIRASKELTRLPVIALTAGAMPEHRANCFEAGVDDFITKPVEVEQLLAVIRLWLSRT